MSSGATLGFGRYPSHHLSENIHEAIEDLSGDVVWRFKQACKMCNLDTRSFFADDHRLMQLLTALSPPNPVFDTEVDLYLLPSCKEACLYPRAIRSYTLSTTCGYSDDDTN